MKGQNFASQVLSRHTFRISRKKGSEFFDHRGTLSYKRTFLISHFIRVISLPLAERNNTTLPKVARKRNELFDSFKLDLINL